MTSLLDSDVEYDLTDCDREPIHIPGTIQAHGALLVLRERDFLVVQASANLDAFLGVMASAVIGRIAADDDIFGVTASRLLRQAVITPGRSGVDPLPLHGANGALLDMTWHRIVDAGANLVIVELEPAEAPGPPLFTTLFEDTRCALDALRGTGSVEGLCRSAAREIQRLSGFDRVMVYRFHPDAHGEVVAEERSSELEPFLGLHYPATDIPVQARRLFLLNPLRVIDDVAYTPAPVLPAQTPSGQPLDLSMAALRAVSPVHLQYLTNMGVRASMTISLFRGSELWGLIACHHYAGTRHIDAQLRAACALLGQMFSLQLVAEEELDILRHRERLGYVEAEVVAAMASSDSLARGFIAGDPLRLADADGLFAQIDGETVAIGRIPPQAAIDELLLELRRTSGVSAGEEVARGWVDLPLRMAGFAAHAEVASGVLAVALSPRFTDVVLFFRGELAYSVTWAGAPTKGPEDSLGAPGPVNRGRLTPRASFAAFLQEVRGHCRPWTSGEFAAGASLARIFPELLLARARLRLARAAMYNSLTGLPNRALVYDRMVHALQKPWSNSRRPALLFLDLDRFKTINDSMGHGIGDEVLTAIADRLRTAVREPDTAGRIGGDEFVVFCDGVTYEQVAGLADRLVRSLREPFVIGGRTVQVTASIGFALAEAASSAADLLSDADTAMYTVKHSGRNGSAPFTPELRAVTVRRTDVETRIQRAVTQDELLLHYQPIFTTGGTLTGFEALARWRSPDLGLVQPTEFIPVAEELGLIEPVTAWALKSGLRDLARWRLTNGGGELTLSVNISPKQMASGLLHQVVIEALTAYRLPPDALCLEITEGALVVNDEVNRRFLQNFYDLGVRMSIDDFGTGFSSLSYLARLPVHELKIDRSFIEGLPGHDNDLAVIGSVVDLAHQLGIVTVAEGVETAEQMAIVKRLGCDLVQGFWTARPMPPEEIDLALYELLSRDPRSTLLHQRAARNGLDKRQPTG